MHTLTPVAPEVGEDGASAVGIDLLGSLAHGARRGARLL
jgi:hypothetical protein